MYFLGVESGETMTQAIVVDLDSGCLLASASCAHQVFESLLDQNRRNQSEVWIQSLDQAVHDCLGSLGSARDDVVAMSVVSQAKDMVLLDQNQQVLTPHDSDEKKTAAGALKDLESQFGGANGLSAHTGNRIDLNSAATRLLATKRADPDYFNQIESVMFPREFLAYWLTGHRGAEVGEVSEFGFLNVAQRAYSDELLQSIDDRLKDWLSALIDPEETHLAVLRKEIAESWGLSREIRVALGSGSAMTRSLSLGVDLPGTAILDFRSAGSIWGLADSPVLDARGEANLWCATEGRWMSHFNQQKAVATLEMLRTHYGWSGLEMEQAAASASLGGEGLLFVPLGYGSRQGNEEGVFHGITTRNFKPRNVARATLEGIAIALSFGFHRMIELGLEYQQIRIAGRGAKSAFWRQLISDVTGVPACRFLNDEGPAMGAVFHAAVSYFREMGQYISYSELTKRLILLDDESFCDPRAERYDYYLEKLSRQQYLVETLVGTGFLD